MSDLVRISISLEAGLAEQLQLLARGSRYTNRSEFVRDLIRQRVVQQEWADARQAVVATITLVYDHHRQGMVKRLMDVQHDFGAVIVSTQHVHLDHHHCLEIIVVKGKASQIQDLVSRFKSMKGVKHNSLVMMSIGKSLA